jgi:hypothetical protein
VTNVSVLILDEVLGVAVELVEKGASLRRRAVLEDALEDAATVRVRSETVDLTDASVGDEVEMLGRNTFESALDDVIALSVASALEDMTVELVDEADLLVDENVLESLYEEKEISSVRGLSVREEKRTF